MSKSYSSPLCSCVICREVKSAKGIHSHWLGSHTVAGKLKYVEAGKAGASSNNIKRKEKALKLREDYLKNPNKCLCCNNDLPYDKRNSKYCGSSCSAKITNTTRGKPTLETRKKQSEGLKRFNANKPKYTKVSQCIVCNKYFNAATGGKCCSLSCRSERRSAVAKANHKLGGNKNTRAYGWYTSKFAGKVWLESSYEYKVALSLDENNINWIRPKYLKYTIDGKTKKYFADFYLKDFDIYLDPKNDYLISLDAPKINQVMIENNVKIIILNKHQLSWGSIRKLLGIGLEPM